MTASTTFAGEVGALRLRVSGGPTLEADGDDLVARAAGAGHVCAATAAPSAASHVVTFGHLGDLALLLPAAAAPQVTPVSAEFAVSAVADDVATISLPAGAGLAGAAGTLYVSVKPRLLNMPAALRFRAGLTGFFGRAATKTRLKLAGHHPEGGGDPEAEPVCD